MSSFNVLVTALHLVPEAQQMLQDAGGHISFMQDPITEDTLIEKLSNRQFDAVLLRGSRPFSARVLAAAKGLKIIAKNGAGIDNVDLNEAARLRMTVAVAAGANADAVAEHAIALMLTLVREIHTLNHKVHQGGWEGTSWLGRDFKGSVVGIIGYGSIGRSTAMLAHALGAKVLVFGRTRTQADQFEVVRDLEQFLSRTDILSLHCPLNEQTRGLIGRKEFAMLKPGVLVINTARGPVIDESALIDALTSGHLGGAGLDTFESEPIKADNPLLNMRQVILTPHVAGVTRDAARRVATMTAQNIIDAIAGKPLPRNNMIVDPASGVVT
jgi:D-3-phosphoglycerate dehydrogenase